jgi:hypothetical protein
VDIVQSIMIKINKLTKGREKIITGDSPHTYRINVDRHTDIETVIFNQIDT